MRPTPSVAWEPMSEQRWDQSVLAWQDHPHYVQGSAWAAAKAGGPWTIEQRDVAGRAVQVFSREATGFGVLQHAPRVSGIRVEDVPALTEAFREQRGDAFSLKLELYQPRDAALESAFAAAGWVPAKASQYRFGITVRTGDGEDQVFADMKKRARNEIRQAREARGRGRARRAERGEPAHPARPHPRHRGPVGGVLPRRRLPDHGLERVLRAGCRAAVSRVRTTGARSPARS